MDSVSNSYLSDPGVHYEDSTVISFDSISFHFFQTPELECSETAQLIERYRFLELFPCTTDELRSMGYKARDIRHGNLHSGLVNFISKF